MTKPTIKQTLKEFYRQYIDWSQVEAMRLFLGTLKKEYNIDQSIFDESCFKEFNSKDALEHSVFLSKTLSEVYNTLLSMTTSIATQEKISKSLELLLLYCSAETQYFIGGFQGYEQDKIPPEFSLETMIEYTELHDHIDFVLGNTKKRKTREEIVENVKQACLAGYAKNIKTTHRNNVLRQSLETKIYEIVDEIFEDKDLQLQEMIDIDFPKN